MLVQFADDHMGDLLSWMGLVSLFALAVRTLMKNLSYCSMAVQDPELLSQLISDMVTPSCFSLSWQFMMVRQVNSWSADSTIGWRLKNGRSTPSIWPLAWTIPCSSRKGDSDTNLLLPETCCFDLRAATSWGNDSAWVTWIQNFQACSISSTNKVPMRRSDFTCLQLWINRVRYAVTLRNFVTEEYLAGEKYSFFVSFAQRHEAQ